MFLLLKAILSDEAVFTIFTGKMRDLYKKIPLMAGFFNESIQTVLTLYLHCQARL